VSYRRTKTGIFLREYVLPEEDRRRLTTAGGYRWFRSENVLDLQRYKVRRDRRARKAKTRQVRAEAAELKRRHDDFHRGAPVFAPADPIDHLEATLDDVLAAATRGEFRGSAVGDFRRLEFR
jgi:hypothetical protein